MDIISQIDRWAELLPDKPAHISGERTLTYGELRRQSDSVANYLAAHVAGREPVAVLGHREPEMLIAFIGCIKAGHPYIPVDTVLPKQRMERILAAASYTLTPDGVAEIARSTPPEPPAATLGKDDAWYIMFTSGSTGDPKGVVLTRGCLEAFMEWILAEQAYLAKEETFLNQTPFTFDLSIMDVYCGLYTGGTVFSISRDTQLNPKRLFQALAASNATVSLATPSFFRVCLSEPSFRAAMMPRMRKFLFCGETLPPGVAAQIMERFPDAEVWNTYGPTEATVAMTSVRLTREILERYPAVPVGAPMPGVKVYLIDDSLAPLPADGRGEIVIAGPNVTPGYLNAPERNAVAFVWHDGVRGYRTGDFGCFRDGYLFCEGRKDGQLKLNGYRIELGDIEANLRGIPGVREAIVLPVMKDGAAQSLTAFVHYAGDANESESDRTMRLKSGLLNRLPTYMLPRKFIYIDDFPMNSNGKVDRRQLSARLT